ncbi:MAG: ferredoxin reductase family protein [Candidatus Woesearchaeota archaeon]
MNRSSVYGLTIITIISLIPVFLLFAYGPTSTNLLSYSEITHKLGQITALIGVTLFALTFVLATRLRIIENLLGGLDKVYMTHGIIGSISLVLLLFHPILLVLKFIPENFNLAAEYLLPGIYWSVNFGIIALLGLAVLIGVTLYAKIKYHKWKISHEFLGLLFIFAMLHIFLIRDEAARDNIFYGYYTFAIIVAIIGITSFIYILLFRNKFAQHKNYTIKNIKIYGDVYGFTFIPKDDALKYKSGQFVFLRFFSKNVSSEPHPFSIASKSNSSELKIYIKKLGDYTSELNQLKIGDKAILEGPYGVFSYTESDLDQIWIAGGIGITPFIGMSQDLNTNMKNKVTLFYAVNSEKEIIELEIFNAIKKINKNFEIITWIRDKNGFLDAKVIKEHCGELKNKEFYICGPPGMKNALTDGLTAQGVKKDKIIMEDFSFR